MLSCHKMKCLGYYILAVFISIIIIISYIYMEGWLTVVLGMPLPILCIHNQLS